MTFPFPSFSSSTFPQRLGALLPCLFLVPWLVGCEQTDAHAAKPPPQALVEVQTVSAAEVTSPELLRLTGTLRGAMEAELAANVAGRVLAVEVDRGDTVKKGQVIARVDVKAAHLALAEAAVSVQSQQTQLAIDQRECERYEQLRESGVVSDQQYQQVTARCKTAPLQLEAAIARESIAAKNVGDGVIRAPFAGIVTERKIEVGEYVQAPTAVVSLAQDQELRLLFSVPERNIPQVKRGATVTLRVPAYPDRTFIGTVSHLAGTVRATRDMLAEATVKNDAGELVPGMFADVEVEVGASPLPGVPQDALFEQNGKTNILVKVDGQLVQRVVQPRPAVKLPDGRVRIPLRAGAQLGEQVVSPRKPGLENGQRVK